ncbi:MAG: hypothetical protein SVU88_00365 [Candidatus Nanohaloarchaea archaeon]|nr:hypothetical protein [Candidatus Nanohaloarchaea archaeon]
MSPDDGDGGRFRLDDEVRTALKRVSHQRALMAQVSNPEQLVDVMDAVSENSEAITDAIDTLVSIHESGALHVLEAASRDELAEYDTSGDAPPIQDLYELLLAASTADLDAVQEVVGSLPEQDEFPTEEWTDPQRTGVLRSVAQLRDPAVQRGIARLFILLRALGAETSAEKPDD